MGSRADNNDGSCRSVLSGRHVGKWRVQYITRDEFGRPHRLSRLFNSQRDGKDFLREIRLDTRAKAIRSKKETTLTDWFQWLAENDWPEELAERTISDRQARFRKYVRPVFGEMGLTRIDPLQVRLFYRNLKTDGIGQPTILAIKRDLVRVFNQAIAPYQRVPMTHANPFRLTLQAAAPRRAVALTPDEARTALSRDSLTNQQRAMLALFLLGGVRLSEQMALTRGQILFDQDLIFIDRSIKFGKTAQQSVGLPKGKKKRLIVMCPTLKRLLLEVARDKDPDRLIWPAATENKARMKKLVYATWRTILRDAKLPSEMSPHDCRLTHINWIEKLMPSVSMTTLKEHVGHSLQGVTEVNYTRPITPAQQLLRDEIERVAGLAVRDEQSLGIAQVSEQKHRVARK